MRLARHQAENQCERAERYQGCGKDEISDPHDQSPCHLVAYSRWVFVRVDSPPPVVPTKSANFSETFSFSRSPLPIERSLSPKSSVQRRRLAPAPSLFCARRLRHPDRSSLLRTRCGVFLTAPRG